MFGCKAPADGFQISAFRPDRSPVAAWPDMRIARPDGFASNSRMAPVGLRRSPSVFGVTGRWQAVEAVAGPARIVSA